MNCNIIIIFKKININRLTEFGINLNMERNRYLIENLIEIEGQDRVMIKS